MRYLLEKTKWALLTKGKVTNRIHSHCICYYITRATTITHLKFGLRDRSDHGVLGIITNNSGGEE